jgi:YD repeat-containing protein
VTLSTSGGVPQAPSASLLRAQENGAYDEQGRAYQDQTFEVNQSTGAVNPNPLTTNTWYDHRGNVIATASPGGLVQKTRYDGADRPVVQYTTDGAGGSTWTAAGSVTGDNVLEQVERTFDANGNVIATVDRQRNHDETATGSLGDANNSPKARVYYSAAYFDAANRPTAQVDVGTNGGTAYTRPATPPASSGTTLVTTETYNGAGWVDTTTDPRGIQQKHYYDALGRVVKDIQDYTDGNPTASSNKTTETTYDGDNNILTVKADEPGGASQTTQYVYGVTTATGSDVNSNDIQSAIQYPDPTTGQPSASQQVTDTVNALGDTKTVSDRNGNVHQLSYDVLGRQVSDAITTLGAGVDGGGAADRDGLRHRRPAVPLHQLRRALGRQYRQPGPGELRRPRPAHGRLSGPRGRGQHVLDAERAIRLHGDGRRCEQQPADDPDLSERPGH